MKLDNITTASTSFNAKAFPDLIFTWAMYCMCPKCGNLADVGSGEADSSLTISCESCGAHQTRPMKYDDAIELLAGQLHEATKKRYA